MTRIPAWAIGEAARCPRAAYIAWLEGGPVEPPVAGDPPRAAHIVAWDVDASDADAGIEARLARLGGHADGAVWPVETRLGAIPATTDPRDVARVSAEIIALRASGHRCDHGVLWYLDRHTPVPVPVDADTLAWAQRLADLLRTHADSERRPPPLVDDVTCLECPLAPLCLPDEVGYLTGARSRDTLDALDQYAPFEAPAPEPRPILAAAADARPLHVGRQGSVIGKRGERFMIRHEGEVLAELPIPDTLSVQLYGNVMLSTQAIRTCLRRGIPIAFHSQTGWLEGHTQGLDGHGLQLRRAQYRAADEPERALAIARRMVGAKIRNQRAILRRNHPDLGKRIPRRLGRLAGQAARAVSLDQLRGYEGDAARLYFGHFGGLLRPPFEFTVRTRRPPRDPVNAALSFCYALLTRAWVGVLRTVGLDPMLGYLHVARAGRPALALDLMEEMRPVLADSVVLTALNGRRLSPDDFVQAAGAWALRPSGRTAVLHAWSQRLDTLITHPVFGYRITWRQTLEVQARLFGRWLAGEIEAYPTLEVR